MEFSVIVPAYREENINKVLGLLLKQNLPHNIKLNKIFLVAAGYEKCHFIKSKKIVIIKEKIRKGKPTAINAALERIETEIIVLQSGDVLTDKNTIRKLLEPFKDVSIAMTTGRPIPLNDKKKIVGFLVHFIWLLHHLVSLQMPKAGEIVAFRNILEKIPRRLVADESYLECIVHKSKKKIKYVPSAVVFNRGPKNVSYFFKQRVRVYIGHLHIKEKFNYSVSTMNIFRIFKAVMKYFEIKSVSNIKEVFWIALALELEIFARMTACLQYYFLNRLPYKWEKIET